MLAGLVALAGVGVALIVLFAGGGGDDATESSAAASTGETPQADGRVNGVAETPSPPGGDPAPVRIRRGVPFIWPADGPVAAEIGPLHTAGIDIALDVGAESPIRASARGTVTLAGFDNRQGLGNQVVIEHGDGLETVYGHLAGVSVSVGQVVAQGELLGMGGASGNAAGKRLHFEVSQDGLQIDPRDVLPPRNETATETAHADCAAEVLLVDSGAPLELDFLETLDSDAAITHVSLTSLTGSASSAAVRASLTGPLSVLFETAPKLTAATDDAFRLTMETDQTSRPNLECTVFVRSTAVEASTFEGPAHAPPPTEPAPQTVSPTETPLPRVTRAPLPTQTPRPTATTVPTPTKTPYPISD